MKYNILLTTLFVSLSLGLHAQNLDSLEYQLETSDGQTKVDILNKLYIAYSRLNPTKAFEYSKNALELATEIDYKRGKAAALNNMGVIYKNQGVYDQALEYYIESLRISTEIDDKEALASTMSNIGTVYSLKGIYDKALIYFIESHDTFKTLKSDKKLVGILNNIGNAYYDMGRSDKALDYFNQAIALSARVGTPGSSSDPLNNIGNIHFYQKEYDQALDYYKQSLEVEKNHQNVLGQALALSNIGSTYLALNDLQKAESFQLEAKNIAEKINAKPILQQIYLGLSEIYYHKGNYKDAYETRTAYDEIKDYVLNEESSRKLAQLEVAFELQRKDKELEILKQERKIQQLQVENSRIVILLGLIGIILLIALGFIVFRLRKTHRVTDS